MVLGEKLFEESGKVTGFKVAKGYRIEGVMMGLSFTSDIRGVGRFPNGKNLVSGAMTRYPHGIIDATWQGTLTTQNGEQFMWWSHEKGKVLQDGKIKGLNIVTGFINSQNLSWMNSLIIVVELVGSIFSEEFSATAYEWN